MPLLLEDGLENLSLLVEESEERDLRAEEVSLALAYLEAIFFVLDEVFVFSRTVDMRDDYLERTYRNLLGPLTLALSPGRFPVFTRGKNPNRLHGTRTGLTLALLSKYGAVDVALWHHDDVPHGPHGYAKKRPSVKDVKIATEALRRCLGDLSQAWQQFLSARRRFVATGDSQLRPLEAIPEIKALLSDAFTFYPNIWILKPAFSFRAVELAVVAAGKELLFDTFQRLVEDAASMSRLDFYANETAEHRAARIQSQLEFAANEAPEHRRERVSKLKATIAKEDGEKRARRLQNLDAAMKTPERRAELKAKYRITIGMRSRATIEAMRRKRIEFRAAETPLEQFQRRERKLAHIRNWKAARAKKSLEARQQESANRRAAWQKRRPTQRAKKCQQLLGRFADMDACDRGYHYNRLHGIYDEVALREDPFGKVLLAFYDANPGKLEADERAWKANAVKKLQEKNYKSQHAYEERLREEKWGPNHASLSRGDKLKLAYAKNREQKAEEAAAAEAARIAAGLEPAPQKEKYASQRIYRERKRAECEALARGEEVQEVSKFAERGQKISAAWAAKRAAKAAASASSSSAAV